jgi:hypothetical protein
MLRLEARITEGAFKGRPFWPSFFVGNDKNGTRCFADGKTDDGLTEGQVTGVRMSREMIRAILEAARGFSPSDETPAAMKARSLSSLDDLDGMEINVVIGVEKGKDGFADKNTIKRVIPAGGAPAAAAAAAPAPKQKSWME